MSCSLFIPAGPVYQQALPRWLMHAVMQQAPSAALPACAGSSVAARTRRQTMLQGRAASRLPSARRRLLATHSPGRRPPRAESAGRPGSAQGTDMHAPARQQGRNMASPSAQNFEFCCQALALSSRTHHRIFSAAFSSSMAAVHGQAWGHVNRQALQAGACKNQYQYPTTLPTTAVPSWHAMAHILA